MLFALATGVSAADNTVASAEAPDTSFRKSETLPKFEFGFAAAALQVPAYPASAVKSDRQFLAPWFIYRSDSVQVKDGGVKLVAYESDKLIIDLGIGAALNADTSDTPLRDGMPDIDYILELGPRFDVPLTDKTTNGIRTRLNWISALRFAVSTDFKRLDYRGPLVNSQLRYRLGGFNDNKLSFSASVFSTWFGDRLSDYIFSVDSEFATDTRPEFDAEAGFLSVGLSASIGYKPTDNLTTFIGVGYTSLAGSKNEDSPLFETDNNANILLGVSWRLYKSKSLVTVREE